MPQPPRSLIVSKVIGRHGAVLTWHPPNLDDLGRSNGLEIVGYKIFVNRQQKQLVTNAHFKTINQWIALVKSSHVTKILSHKNHIGNTSSRILYHFNSYSI